MLGYRPRPAIGATGILAALVAPSVLSGQTVTLPRGLQFQSKPGPGQAPQTFELMQATPIGLPDRVPALPPPNLIADLGSISWDEYSIGGMQYEEELYYSKKSKKVKKEVQGPTKEYHTTSTPQYGVLLKGSVTSLSNGDVSFCSGRATPPRRPP